jgi:hypothetical protein
VHEDGSRASPRAGRALAGRIPDKVMFRTSRARQRPAHSFLLGNKPRGVAREAYARVLRPLGAAVAQPAVGIECTCLPYCPIGIQCVLGWLPIESVARESPARTYAVEAGL